MGEICPNLCFRRADEGAASLSPDEETQEVETTVRAIATASQWLREC